MMTSRDLKVVSPTANLFKCNILNSCAAQHLTVTAANVNDNFTLSGYGYQRSLDPNST